MFCPVAQPLFYQLIADGLDYGWAPDGVCDPEMSHEQLSCQHPAFR